MQLFLLLVGSTLLDHFSNIYKMHVTFHGHVKGIKGVHRLQYHQIWNSLVYSRLSANGSISMEIYAGVPSWLI